MWSGSHGAARTEVFKRGRGRPSPNLVGCSPGRDQPEALARQAGGSMRALVAVWFRARFADEGSQLSPSRPRFQKSDCTRRAAA